MEEDIDNRPIRRILQIDLGLKPYRKRKLHGLSAKETVTRLKRYIPENIRTVQRFQHSGSTMVWGAVSYNGKIPLKFIEEGVKINTKHYQNEMLRSTLMPNISTLYSDNQWIFQQDSAPAHKAKSTQQWLVDNCPDFISSEE
ncbi:unnamed protein product [Rotaria socialis]|uniref:Transposase n=1 Tax=Rotaria socialis TaxID=392032 RepID=A0A821ME43_9BILA|nr:unnamed protein product [Rotaria socialis]